jgi:IclR family acetate operon transcriptional repressor
MAETDFIPLGEGMNDSKSRSSGQVRSLTRALSLLRHLAASGDGMSLTELSDAASLPPSTTHRLLTTLESERFVRPEPQGGLWRIGVAAFFVGSAFARSRDKLTLVRPYLRRLMELSGETANLFVESDGEAICIGQIESRHAMRAITGVGGRVLLHSSGAGKVLLAHMENARLQRLLATMDLPRETPRTITDRGRLEVRSERPNSGRAAAHSRPHGRAGDTRSDPRLWRDGANRSPVALPTTPLVRKGGKSARRRVSALLYALTPRQGEAIPA